MTKLRVVRTNKFKKHYKKVSKWSKFDQNLFEDVVGRLANLEELNIRHRDHKLIGELKGYRECHVQPDLLLIYQIRDEELILVLFDIGSHSKLFG